MSNQYQPYNVNQGQVQQWHQNQIQSNPQYQQSYQQQTGYQPAAQSPISNISGLFEAALPILVLVGLLWISGLFSGNKQQGGNWSGVFTFLTVVLVAGIGLYLWSEIKALL
ncbi:MULTISPECIES: hypothetical protein [unclassified Pannonibacter]|uniref:hypothetical protein n=1 Tax=unclassified Pannonibacter TaxID=2627228 RepID=UPI001645929E|nr:MULTISPECIES: hypothetical protein [unclassified Pannonibacter]